MWVMWFLYSFTLNLQNDRHMATRQHLSLSPQRALEGPAQESPINVRWNLHGVKWWYPMMVSWHSMVSNAVTGDDTSMVMIRYPVMGINTIIRIVMASWILQPMLALPSLTGRSLPDTSSFSWKSLSPETGKAMGFSQRLFRVPELS